MAYIRELSLEDIVDLPGPLAKTPIQPGFSRDGERLWYLFPEGEATRLVLREYRLEDGAVRTLLAPADAVQYTQAELLRRERERVRWDGISTYQVVERDGVATILSPMGGRLLLKGGEAEPAFVPEVAGAEDPTLLSDGRRVVFVRDGDLWMAEVGTGETTPLTRGAEPGLTYGLAEYVAQEELGRSHGYWVSPRLTWIAYQETDARDVPEYPIVHLEGERPWVETARYPLAGEANARVRLGVMPLDGGDTRWMDWSGEDGYLARVEWASDDTLAVAWLSRDHRHLRWTLWDPRTGASRPLMEETSGHWVNLGSIHRFLADGSFLTSSEEDGFRHLYVYPTSGERRQLTRGPWLVTHVTGVDETAGWVYFVATRESPLERHLYRVPLSGGEPERLTEEAGLHAVVMADDCRWFLDQWHNRRHSMRAVVRRTDGAAAADLTDVVPATAESIGLEPPELVTLTADDGTPLYGALYRPRGGVAPWPAVVSVYGGPHAQTVGETWALTTDFEAQYLAQRGYLVFKLDNRGMANRGVAFEKAIHRAFGTVEVADQVTGVRWLVDNRQVDPRRVGIFGWSYGGYMTLMCLEKAPDVFCAGVAGAPVTDYRFYDTAYTERYMETPATNPAGYDEGSALTHVQNLTGHLLVIHGLLDENVHFRNTARYLLALLEAGKPYDLMLLPASRHGPRGRATRLAIVKRRTEYLTRFV